MTLVFDIFTIKSVIGNCLPEIARVWAVIKALFFASTFNVGCPSN
jgi:hypothetical protein